VFAQALVFEAYRRVRVDTALLDPVRPSHRGGRTTGRRSVEAFDDAEVALEAVGEFGQRLLVGRTLVRGDRLFEAVELDQDDALGDSGFVCDDPAADAGEHPPACGRDG